MTKRLLIIALVLLHISCDQASKSIIRDKIEDHKRISVIKDYLILTKEENKGAMLGLGSELNPELKVGLLIIFPVIVMMIMLIVTLFEAKQNNWVLFGLTLIIGGGLSNLLDRILYGSVTDFLHLDLVIFKTGIFNVADMSILLGAGIVIYHSFLADRAKAVAKRETQI